MDNNNKAIIIIKNIYIENVVIFIFFLLTIIEFLFIINYNKDIINGNTSLLYNIQGINIIIPIIIGNNIVQQYDINWSKRILG